MGTKFHLQLQVCRLFQGKLYTVSLDKYSYMADINTEKSDFYRKKYPPLAAFGQ